MVAGERVGELGEIDPEVAEAHGIAERVAWMSLDLTRLAALPHGERPYRLVSRYPSADIDLAFEVPDDVPVDVGRVDAAARRSASWSRTIRLFDVFRGDPVGAGSRSLAFALRLQAADRTLTDAEVQELRQRAIAAVESAHEATLRGLTPPQLVA